MAESTGEEGGLQRTAKDLASGAAGGIAQVLLGMYDINAIPSRMFNFAPIGFDDYCHLVQIKKIRIVPLHANFDFANISLLKKKHRIRTLLISTLRPAIW